MYTTEVFTAFAALFDFGRAIVLTLPLLFVTGAERRCRNAARLTRRRHPPARTRCASLALDVARAASRPCYRDDRDGPGSSDRRLGSRSLYHIDSAARSWLLAVDPISLLLATVGATLVVAVGARLGYARARASSRLGSLTDVLCVMLFAVPSTIVGVALIGLWNRPGIVGAVYGTSAMFVLVYLARFLPVAVIVVAAAVRQVPMSHEEASAVAGAGWLRTVTDVVIPQVARGLAAAWLVVFVFAFGELGASVLVSPPGESTLPIRIYTIIANTPSSVVAALALFQAGVIFVPLAVAGLYLTRRAAL